MDLVRKCCSGENKGFGQFDIFIHLSEESVVENEDFSQYVKIFLYNYTEKYVQIVVLNQNKKFSHKFL